MTILIVTLLLVVTVAVLAYPFMVRRARAPGFDDPAGELAGHLRRSRDRVYEEIRALQQEYFLDTMTEAEYRSRLAAARLQAAGLLRQQQQVQQTIADIDATVDEEMRLASGESPGEQS